MSYNEDYEALEAACEELAEAGVNVVVNTVRTPDAEEECYQLGKSEFGDRPVVVFVIDMGCREIYLRGLNGAEKIITRGRCRSITDNSYKLATNKQYEKCAADVIRQCVEAYTGGKIAQPMEYIVNIFISLMAGITIVYLIIVVSRENKSASASERRAGTRSSFNCSRPQTTHIRTIRTKHSSSSSGGGGGHGGGGHGGGGGGHSF